MLRNTAQYTLYLWMCICFLNHRSLVVSLFYAIQFELVSLFSIYVDPTMLHWIKISKYIAWWNASAHTYTSVIIFIYVLCVRRLHNEMIIYISEHWESLETRLNSVMYNYFSLWFCTRQTHALFLFSSLSLHLVLPIHFMLCDWLVTLAVFSCCFQHSHVTNTLMNSHRARFTVSFSFSWHGFSI